MPRSSHKQAESEDLGGLLEIQLPSIPPPPKQPGKKPKPFFKKIDTGPVKFEDSSLAVEHLDEVSETEVHIDELNPPIELREQAPDIAHEKLTPQIDFNVSEDKPPVVDYKEPKPPKKGLDREFLDSQIRKIDFFVENSMLKDAKRSFEHLKQLIERRKAYEKYNKIYALDFKRIKASIELLEIK